jgi:hypothetical protein
VGEFVGIVVTAVFSVVLAQHELALPPRRVVNKDR